MKARSRGPREGRVARPERRMRERMRGEQSGVRMEETRKGREERGKELWWRQEQEEQQEKQEKHEHRWQRQRQQRGQPLLRRCTNAVRCNSQKKKKKRRVSRLLRRQEAVLNTSQTCSQTRGRCMDVVTRCSAI